ncbi:hypothetical protein K8Z61_03270 [Nocardioides sp. TRM66260-LWL]|uniref:hypothetical protein n=1 Tax=Nocardioides sp. TRM66260-LWL TaxID=2874478 RepID=UPI001CC508BD|nr:hypothetical protein [Nocardioides sp. TRM66260-LWL]MBZ5733506.1 hypothetical protein [Nocardioides sp. TRM66260-LWL]
MIEAHGIGGQADLPIPLSLAVGGAGVALVLSFVVMTIAWRSTRYDGEAAPQGRPVSSRIARVLLSVAWRRTLQTAGMALFAYTVIVALFGQDSLTNPFFGIVYVWWWVGLVFASLLFGPVWRSISPLRTIHALLSRATGGDREHGIYTYPAQLGYWPAALGLFAFVWLELVYDNSSSLGDVRLWCTIYVAIMLVGGSLFGSTFYQKADPFEVYSTLMGRLSPWHITHPAAGDGDTPATEDDAQTATARLVLRSPLANLAGTPPVPGLIAVVAVLFGSTAFDSFGNSPFWIRTIYNSSLSANILNNLALIVFCVAAGTLFALGSMLTQPGDGRRRTELPGLFAHSLAPIIAAYVLAHYITLFADYGLQTLGLVSDPFGKGWNLFGTAALAPTFWFSYHPTLLASIKVGAVVAGHVTAAIAAHDRALSVLAPQHRITGQIPLLITMVGFTTGGLLLLFSA